jgi:quercetin dioxygenase-like cupin family protein
MDISETVPALAAPGHPHDGGQILYVSEGPGLVQPRDQEAVELHADGIVLAPDGEEYPRGATPDDFMIHV